MQFSPASCKVRRIGFLELAPQQICRWHLQRDFGDLKAADKRATFPPISDWLTGKETETETETETESKSQILLSTT